ncbi:molybdenum cofactor guanylyltransferase [Acetobacterium woodii]|uniref:Probable molybdenum cofactor guanylyltransferase n=1 Tax=Acetobacterium woodii (strain ATCC 29683 / DSM 1030 / JCM 2381 / KCTC 1655 / WB1) TaxID=931626 RepID=H6LB82_ACEWD|nr:molybdenum cofactor guanylyltransferase [Acetobacterium woodii]AFA47634.1 molybdopterin-guanine dinucleotide biosynthesis protein A [Acetobacterium woodii DSM 1030]
MQYFELSFLILAGGKSSRMGVNKAELDFNGQTFLETLITKAQKLGFTDIIISGYPHKTASITPVMDEFINRGPLGGLYSSFKVAKHPYCFVLCVDVPQLTEQVITSLIDYHFENKNELTLLRQNDRIEPLIGIYPASSYQKIYPLIKNGSASVFRLIDQYDYSIFDINNNDQIAANINTPEDYQHVLKKNLLSITNKK